MDRAAQLKKAKEQESTKPQQAEKPSEQQSTAKSSSSGAQTDQPAGPQATKENSTSSGNTANNSQPNYTNIPKVDPEEIAKKVHESFNYTTLAQNILNNVNFSGFATQNPQPTANVAIDYTQLEQMFAKFFAHFAVNPTGATVVNKCSEDLTNLKLATGFTEKVNNLSKDSERIASLKKEFRTVYTASQELQDAKKRKKDFEELQKYYDYQLQDPAVKRQAKDHIITNQKNLFTVMEQIEQVEKKYKEFLSENLKGTNSRHHQPIKDISVLKAQILPFKPGIKDLVTDYCTACAHNYEMLSDPDQLVVIGICTFYNLETLEIFK